MNRKYIVSEIQLREIGELVFDDGQPVLKSSGKRILDVSHRPSKEEIIKMIRENKFDKWINKE